MNELIQTYLEDRGITKEYLARETGISKKELNDICSGRKKLDVYNYVLICRALHISIEYFAELYMQSSVT